MQSIFEPRNALPETASCFPSQAKSTLQRSGFGCGNDCWTFCGAAWINPAVKSKTWQMKNNMVTVANFEKPKQQTSGSKETKHSLTTNRERLGGIIYLAVNGRFLLCQCLHGPFRKYRSNLPLRKAKSRIVKRASRKREQMKHFTLGTKDPDQCGHYSKNFPERNQWLNIYE